MRSILLFFFLIASLFSLAQSEHVLFSQLLSKHVSSEGMVNYKGLLKDKSKLDIYLAQISATDPETLTSELHQLAFWINAYNAFTLAIILENYPIQSITDLHPIFYVPGVNSVWHYTFFAINGEEMSLDFIEHKILRKQFKEPRFHFAINCASYSCPVLRNEAYEAKYLEAQLDDQARRFINDEFRNYISYDKLKLSKIFSWFKEDFTDSETLVEFIQKYSVKKIAENPKIEFLSYNWDLNEN